MRFSPSAVYFLSFLVGIIIICLAQLALWSGGEFVHSSDQRFYYDADRGKFLDGTLVYSYMNGILKNIFIEHAHQIVLKIFNLSIFILGLALMKLHQNVQRTTFLIILFNPYLYMIVGQNIRDLYIILCVLAFVFCRNFSRHTYIGFVSLFRPLLSVIMFLSTRFRRLNIAIFMLILLLAYGLIFWDPLREVFFLQFASGLHYYGRYEEYYPMFVEFSSGGGSLVDLILFSYIVIRSLLIFIFTPLPSNWLFSNIIAESSSFYTELDLYLIFVGSLLYWLVILPRVDISRVLRGRCKINTSLFLYIAVSLSYSIFHLGGTDLRLKYLAIVLLVVGLDKADCFNPSVIRTFVFAFFVVMGFFMNFVAFDV